MRFAHIADLHLGFRQYNLVECERDFYAVFEATLEEIAHRKPDLLVVAGDLFHYKRIRPGTLRRVKESLSGFVVNSGGARIVGVEGNHDRSAVGAEETWVSVLGADGVMRVLGTQGQPEVLELPEVRIVGIPYAGWREAEMLAQVKEILAGMPRRRTILICHIGVAGTVRAEAGGLPLARFHELLDGLVDYVATGHFHVPFDDGLVFQPGALRPTAVDQPYGGFYWVDWRKPSWEAPAEFVPVTSYCQARMIKSITLDSLADLEVDPALDGAIVQLRFKAMPTRSEVEERLGDVKPLRLTIVSAGRGRKAREASSPGGVTERQVLEGLLPSGQVQVALTLKRMVLDGESDEALLAFLEDCNAD